MSEQQTDNPFADLSVEELDERFNDLFAQVLSLGEMPMDTSAQKLARYEKRAEVCSALADVYAAMTRKVEPGSVVAMALRVAAREARDSAERAGLSAKNTRSRMNASDEEGLQ